MTNNQRFLLLVEFSKAALTGVMSQVRLSSCPRCANYGSDGSNIERARYVVAAAEAVVDELEKKLEGSAKCECGEPHLKGHP